MIKLAMPNVAQPILATPKLSRVQLKSIDLTCKYYGWSYNYSVIKGKSKLEIVIDDIAHEIKVIGRDFWAIKQGELAFNLSRSIKLSRKFAEAGIFKIPKKLNEESFKEMLWESVWKLAAITPQLQLHNEQE